MTRLWLLSGTALGFLSVALGAFGAHALRAVLDEYGKSIYETAVQYQMFHAMALLITGILQRNLKDVSFAPAGWAFLAGTVLFSGSLYVLSVTGVKWLGAITPFGGVAFLIGWVSLLIIVARTKL